MKQLHEIIMMINVNYPWPSETTSWKLLSDIHAGHVLDGCRNAGHDHEHLVRQLGGPNVSWPVGNHSDLLGLR